MWCPKRRAIFHCLFCHFCHWHGGMLWDAMQDKMQLSLIKVNCSTHFHFPVLLLMSSTFFSHFLQFRRCLALYVHWIALSSLRFFLQFRHCTLVSLWNMGSLSKKSKRSENLLALWIFPYFAPHWLSAHLPFKIPLLALICVREKMDCFGFARKDAILLFPSAPDASSYDRRLLLSFSTFHFHSLHCFAPVFHNLWYIIRAVVNLLTQEASRGWIDLENWISLKGSAVSAAALFCHVCLQKDYIVIYIAICPNIKAVPRFICLLIDARETPQSFQSCISIAFNL